MTTVGTFIVVGLCLNRFDLGILGLISLVVLRYLVIIIIIIICFDFHKHIEGNTNFFYFFSFNHVADKSLEVKPYGEKKKVFGMIYCFEPHEEEEEVEEKNE